MSFWDTQEQDDNSLSSLLEKQDPDMVAILNSPELIQSFRIKDSQLMSVLTNHQNLSALFDIIFTSQEIKTSKKGIELFKSKSPLLKEVLSDQKLAETCIARISSGDSVHIGYATSLFVNCFEEEKSLTLNLFNSSSQILPTLFTHCHLRSVLELLLVYIANTNEEGRWFLWSAIVLAADKEAAECPDIWKNAPCTKFASIIKNAGINLQQRNILISIIEDYATKCKEQQILGRFSSYLPTLFGIEQFRVSTLKLALVLPKNDEFVSIAKKAALMPLPSNAISVLALSVVTKFAVDNCSDVFQALSSKFIADGVNTFFMVEYINFFRAASKNEEILQKASELFAPYLLANATKEKWRQSIPRIGYLLEIADIIDATVKIAEWADFRANELSQWRTKEQDAPKDSNETTTTTLTQRMAASEDGISIRASPQIAVAQQKPVEVARINKISEEQPKEPIPEPEKIENKEQAPPVITEKPKEVASEPHNAPIPVTPKPAALAALATKPQVHAPLPMKPIAPPVKKTLDVSVDSFLQLINDPYWAYTGPTPEEIFHVKESFESAEEAFDFLVKQQ